MKHHKYLVEDDLGMDIHSNILECENKTILHFVRKKTQFFESKCSFYYRVGDLEFDGIGLDKIKCCDEIYFYLFWDDNGVMTDKTIFADSFII